MIPVAIWYEYHTSVFAVYDSSRQWTTKLVNILGLLCLDKVRVAKMF